MFVIDSETDLPTSESSTSRADLTSDMAHSDGSVGSSTWAPGYPPSFESVTHIPSPLAVSTAKETLGLILQ